MRTIVVASQKGGAGKSTLVAHMSVLADVDASPCLVIDTDPQASMVLWYELRSNETPAVAKGTARSLPQILDAARTDRVTWCFVDTPPHDDASIAAAMRTADFIIIPTRPAAFDLGAVRNTVAMALALKVPHLVVINGAPPGRGFGEPTVTAEARAFLERLGANVWDGVIVTRANLMHALAGGMSVAELEPDGQADREMKRLWRDVRALMENRK